MQIDNIKTFQCKNKDNHADCKYLYIQDFLKEHECNELIHFFENEGKKSLVSINDVYKTESIFDNRIIWYSHIADDCSVKKIMKESKHKIIESIKDLYNISYIHSDGIMLNVWPDGSSMGEHFDNQYFDDGQIHTPWREYSAVAYLNDEYEGGEFYFAESESPLAIKPKKGSVLIFGAGPEYKHGVKQVVGGRRYTMPSWYTSDLAHIEA